MDTNKIFEVYQATLVDGGHTLEPKGRYLVGLKRFERIIEVKDFSTGSIADYIRDVLPKDIKNATLGTWKNKGKIYLDTSVAFNDLATAIETAKKERQIAIYDIKKNEDIII